MPADVGARLLAALDRSPSTVVTLVDADLRTRWMSESARWVLGVDPASRVGRQPLDRVHPDDVERIVRGIRHLQVAGTRTPNVPVMEPVRYRVRAPDGNWQVMQAVVHNLLDDPEVNGLVVETRLTSGPLDGAGHVVDLLVANAPLPDVLAACAGLVEGYLGNAAVVAVVDGETVTGAPAATPAADLVADDRWWRDALADGAPRAPAGFDGVPGDAAAAAGAAGFRSFRVVPLLEPSTGAVMGCVVVWLLVDLDPGQDISTNEGLSQTARLASLVINEQRRHHALRREALTDPLTGVGNRSALRRRLDAAAGPVSVALVDLDDFKAVNDTYGHDAGDAVLREVAARLARAVREDDLVVRFGGDEFAVVFADGDPRHVLDRAARRIVEAIEAPVPLGPGRSVSVAASVGLATDPACEVIGRADAALYEVKGQRTRARVPAPAPPAGPADDLV